MLCEDCHENEAEVLVTEVDAEGSLKEKHLCKACASKKGYLLDKEKPLLQMFNEFLKEYGEGEEGEGGEGGKKDEEFRCSVCGMSWAEFRSIGRFGCEKCYHEFGDRVEKLISRIQGTSQHVGRKASQDENTVSLEMEKKRLRQQLAKAIQHEEYEKAAKIRDDLRKYEERIE
jgi:protein arginine kinase activator